MLVGNEWQHLILTERSARNLVKRTAHRGYTIEPFPSFKNHQ